MASKLFVIKENGCPQQTVIHRSSDKLAHSPRLFPIKKDLPVQDIQARSIMSKFYESVLYILWLPGYAQQKVCVKT